MKAKININGKETEIELTPDQVKFIKDKSFDFKDIDSLQAALDYNGKTLERFIWETERDTDQQKATKELEEIAKALREGKELEMATKWYYPYFYKNVSAAGSVAGFSYYDAYYDYVRSNVGARRVFPSREDFEHAVKVFPELFKDTMTIPEK